MRNHTPLRLSLPLPKEKFGSFKCESFKATSSSYSLCGVKLRYHLRVDQDRLLRF